MSVKCRCVAHIQTNVETNAMGGSNTVKNQWVGDGTVSRDGKPFARRVRLNTTFYIVTLFVATLSATPHTKGSPTGPTFSRRAIPEIESPRLCATRIYPQRKKIYHSHYRRCAAQREQNPCVSIPKNQVKQLALLDRSHVFH